MRGDNSYASETVAAPCTLAMDEREGKESRILSTGLPESISAKIAQGAPSGGKYRERSSSSTLIGTTSPVSLLSLIHISEPTRLGMISYAVFCLKKKKKKKKKKYDIIKKNKNTHTKKIKNITN